MNASEEGELCTECDKDCVADYIVTTEGNAQDAAAYCHDCVIKRERAVGYRIIYTPPARD